MLARFRAKGVASLLLHKPASDLPSTGGGSFWTDMSLYGLALQITPGWSAAAKRPYDPYLSPKGEQEVG